MAKTIRTAEPATTKIPHELARDPRISHGARGLAVQMLCQPDGFRSDAEFLTTLTGDSRTAIRRQLAELIRFGYLVRERVRDDKGHITTRSVLYDTPQPIEQPPSEKPRPSLVYGIGSAGHTSVKIGVTTKLSARLAELQTSSPFPLSVLWTREGDPSLEFFLHERLRKHLVQGEWFDLGDDPAAKLTAAAADYQPGRHRTVRKLRNRWER